MVFFFTTKEGCQLYMGKDKFENEDLIKYGWPEDVWFHVDNLSSAHVYVRLPQGSIPKLSAAQSGIGTALTPAELLEIGNSVMDSLPEDVIRDCSQLVKENSIEGCKKPQGTCISSHSCVVCCRAVRPPFAPSFAPHIGLYGQACTVPAHGHRLHPSPTRPPFPPAVTVVYTPWYNLKKTNGMEVGQVGFHQDKLVRKFVVMEKDRDTLKRLEKTRSERAPDPTGNTLKGERETRDGEERAKYKAEQKAKAAADRELQEQRKKEKEERSYDRLFEKAKAAPAAGSGGGKKGGKGGGKYADREGGAGAADGLADDIGAFGIKPTTDASAAKKAEEDFM